MITMTIYILVANRDCVKLRRNERKLYLDSQELQIRINIAFKIWRDKVLISNFGEDLKSKKFLPYFGFVLKFRQLASVVSTHCYVKMRKKQPEVTTACLHLTHLTNSIWLGTNLPNSRKCSEAQSLFISTYKA